MSVSQFDHDNWHAAVMGPAAPLLQLGIMFTSRRRHKSLRHEDVTKEKRREERGERRRGGKKSTRDWIDVTLVTDKLTPFFQFFFHFQFFFAWGKK